MTDRFKIKIGKQYRLKAHLHFKGEIYDCILYTRKWETISLKTNDKRYYVFSTGANSSDVGQLMQLEETTSRSLSFSLNFCLQIAQ